MATARRSSTVYAVFAVVCLLCLSPGSAQVDPDAIVGVWLFDEGSGSLAKDSSGHGYDADLKASPAWVGGRHGSALEFNGASYLEIRESSANLAFGGTAPFSITAWVKNRGGGTIMSKYNAGVIGAYILRIGGGGTVSFHREVEPWSYSGSLTLPNDEFGHVAVTYDGATMRIYVNGVPDAEQARGAQNTDTVTPVLIGAQWTGGVPSEFFSGVLDEVALFDVALTVEEITDVMRGLTSSKATAPIPADGATDVARDTSLSWTATDTAVTHDVYFGTSWADVNAATAAAPRGVLVSQGQTEPTYTPSDVLTYGTTYFWRIDEVNGAPDYTAFKGNVWSFTVETFAYPIRNIIATSNAASGEMQGPENTVNGSGLNADDKHSIETTDMWLVGPSAETVYIQYEFDNVYKLHEMLVWNYNVPFEPLLGFGLKDVTIEYSENGADWTVWGDVQFAQATARSDYSANTTVDLGGIAARFVKIVIRSGYGLLGQYGLSEVRFLFVPVVAREPRPADGAADVAVDATLRWRAGRGAAMHQVHLSPDEAAVAEGAALADTVADASYTPPDLHLATTYFWKIDEVDEADPAGTWSGQVWSFTTQEFLVVDDFEAYTDDEGSRIFETWVDGWENQTGSTVGHLDAPFAERAIVHSGSQAMPLFYDNAGVAVAEAVRTFDAPQDWTPNGIQSLSLYFRGAQGNDGRLYLKINGTKVEYSGDAADINKSTWQPWNIDLSSVGADVSRVTELTIGVEGAGAAGVVYIDDLRLYPGTPEFITPIEPDPANLVLYYALDEGSGRAATDSAGSGNHGTIEGNPAWITGISGSALSFHAGRDYVTTGKSLLNDLTEFTIACWLKGDLSQANRSGLIGQNDCIEYGISAGNNIQIWSAASGAVNLAWPYDATADWHHIVAVGNGTVVTIYLDGRAAVSGGTAITDTYGSSAFPVNIGGGGIFDATENWLTGDIDEIYIYQRALSAAEVAGLAGRTQPLAIPF
ncbi:MAG: LamG-like jellyroll fold domain-containing protein [Sedimentisphaerales bacterium]|nr:LamG-like jellyroll fold domain-containing protein [Sedimentisphaerales bacterium]HNY78924.1 hypothetical protein [Sedimentisphaerales bacterium]HOC62660.1 hypothetical protein [Sedimentisphaerales bacterium]HOH64858.1 hypothetical protein [Sedimentisphaerales bacterium]HPY49032.1 hypothetical protein [Sedimentisphaerales bacterium]